MTNIPNFNSSKFLLRFLLTFLIFYTFYLENYDVVLYNISFNLTIINQATKKTSGSLLVDSILSTSNSKTDPIILKSEGEPIILKSEAEPIMSKSEAIIENKDNTPAANNNNITDNININKYNFSTSYTPKVLLTYLLVIKAYFNSFKLLTFKNFDSHIIKTLKFIFNIIFYCMAFIGFIVIIKYFMPKAHKSNSNILYTLYHDIIWTLYDFNQNILINIRDFINSYIDIKDVKDNISPLADSQNINNLQNINNAFGEEPQEEAKPLKNYTDKFLQFINETFPDDGNSDKPFYKQIHFYKALGVGIGVGITSLIILYFTYDYYSNNFDTTPKPGNSNLLSPIVEKPGTGFQALLTYDQTTGTYNEPMQPLNPTPVSTPLNSPALNPIDTAFGINYIDPFESIIFILIPSLIRSKLNLMYFIDNFKFRFNNLLNKVFIIININKLPNGEANILLIIFILISIIATILIRFDTFLNILNNLPYKLEVSIRIISALYSIFSILLIMIAFKHLIALTKLYLKKGEGGGSHIGNSIYLSYTLYFTFIFLANIILYFINGYAIRLLL